MIPSCSEFPLILTRVSWQRLLAWDQSLESVSPLELGLAAGASRHEMSIACWPDGVFLTYTLAGT